MSSDKMGMPQLRQGVTEKSVFNPDTRIQYCKDMSIRPTAEEAELTRATVERGSRTRMLGAPEAIHLCANLIRLIKGKRCIDVGVFTGSSTLAWALAVPEDGEVHALDIQREDFDAVGAPLIEKAGVAGKVKWHIGDAVASLDKLIADGQAGTFDFAFIDALKSDYPAYYEKCLTLLRPGGVIAVDNSLLGGRVHAESNDGWSDVEKESIETVKGLNKTIHEDARVDNSLLAMADGLNLCFKK